MKSKSLPIRKVSLDVKGTAIAVMSQNGDDYICVTDIARYQDSERTDYIIQNWLRNRNTIEFLGIWEQLNNPDFNPIEFDGIRKQAGLNTFILTAKRLDRIYRRSRSYLQARPVWRNLRAQGHCV